MTVAELLKILVSTDQSLEVVLYSPLDGEGDYVSIAMTDEKTVRVNRAGAPRKVFIITE